MTKPPPAAATYRLNPKRRILRKLVLFSVAAALVGHQWWGRTEDRSLQRRVAELRRSGEPLLPQDFQSTRVSPADNAANLLRSASAAAPDTAEQWNSLDIDALGSPLTPSEAMRIRRVTERFGAAMERASAALAKPDADWGEPLVSPVLLQRSSETFLSQTRLANFLGVAILRAHHDGNEVLAVRHVREILWSSRVTGRHPHIWPHTASVGIAQTALVRLNQIAPTLCIESDDGSGGLQPQDVRAIIDELLNKAALDERVVTALRGDRAWRYDAIRSMADGHAPVRLLWSRGPEDIGWADELQRVALRPLILGDGQVIFDDVDRAMAAAGEPDWPAASTRMSQEWSEWRNRYLRHYVACMLTPDYSRYVKRHFVDLTNRRLAAVSLAVRWYVTEHDGRTPASLDDLVPKYLPAVPLDPMARHRRVGYVADPHKPVVYSVGDDGVDDGGNDTPLSPNIEHPDLWFCRDVVVHLKPKPRRPADVDVVFPPPPDTDAPVE